MSAQLGKRVALALAISTIAIIAACSNSEEATPSRTVVPAGSTSSGSTGTVGSSGVDGGDQDANIDPSCEGAEGCFKCEATRSIDILNSCTDGTCTPFDNVARLPLFKAGEALPPIP